ncbi:LemA family protein [Leifsonia sp. Leaf264]|uniref:LemA family protein n=1 Tax=Leifsonia sp. Leaf264 TaxID=1736314 RepID=UPI0006F8D87E|nr:LemA family protein [Leifsonia sp. Leaf264]KQO98865.1 hypothetical protein ASF30_12445 [Leifsonia sp. Leaf264]
MGDETTSPKSYAKWFWIGGAALVVMLSSGSVVGTYNGVVSSRETVNATLSDLDAQYQRRADLIPNLVAAVKEASEVEKTTLSEVVAARSKATGVHLGENPSEAEVAAFEKAQADLGAGIGKLLAVAEAYPQLKSQDGFLNLQSQLEGTENRITVARGDYNDAARVFNTQVSSFPTVLVANLLGQGEKFEYFQAAAGSEDAAEVSFDK